MPQKILIALDESDNARRAVDFVARTFAPTNQVTLFSVIVDTAAICNMDSPELTPIFKSQQAAFCVLENKKRELVADAARKAREVLVNAGFAADRVTVKCDAKKRGVARDILAEGGKGYDLIVIGRRGVSAVKDFLLGSTSQKVLNGAGDLSVLIVN